MSEAMKAGFYIEAIAIQESILSDRLLSRLHGAYDVPIQLTDKKGRKRDWGFCQLIEKLGSTAGSEAKPEDYSVLVADLHRFRDGRNRTIHSLAKSMPGSPTEPVEDFIERAKATADLGKTLVTRLKEWKGPKNTANP